MQLIDVHHLGRAGIICPGLAGTSELTLLDCGPACSFEGSLAAIRRLGFQPQQVSRVLLTHIHLDHAGAAWRWAGEFGATIYVHPRGYAHLLDPSKLLASARRVFGEQMERLWGDLQPIPASNLKVIDDGEWIGEGETRFRAIATPGHAQHHHAYWHATSSSLYAGDVAGVSIQGGPLVPPCPPPDLDLAAWRESLARLRALAPRRILLTHGGILTDIAALDVLEHRLEVWSRWVLREMQAGHPEEEIIPAFERFVWSELRAAGLGDEQIAAYEQGDPAAMSAAGLARYWRKFHPEALGTPRAAGP
jgi:glyoxylase-like metal-dependent hydrolase (beta-lactamase superfamily II)